MRWICCLACCFAWITFAPAASAQGPDDRYQLTLSDRIALPAQPVEVPMLLDIVPGTLGLPDPVIAWSMGVCHDSTILTLSSVQNGVTSQTVNAGGSPDFVAASVLNDGFTLGVVIDLFGNESLAPGVGYELHVITYEPAAGVPNGTITPIDFCMLGNPPVSPALGIVGGAGVTPVTMGATITIGAPIPIEEFDRGDCNDDGGFNIGDVIFFLGFLFPQGVPNPLVCADACDMNDDGSLNLADGVSGLSALFGQPAVALPAPFGACGVDPTDMDPLDCPTSSCP